MNFDPDRFAIPLLKSMLDAVICSDADGKILYWNDDAEAIFGFVATGAIGQSLDVVLSSLP